MSWVRPEVHSPTVPTTASPVALTDEEVAERVRGGEIALFEVIMRRYNQRLYRVARGIVGDGDAEDVLQTAYVQAFAHLDQFAGRARFSTWLTRIVVHEALARARRGGRFVEMKDETPMIDVGERSPEERVGNRELATVLEAAVEDLSPPYRAVFMLRDVEGMSTLETADTLEIPAETVKTRLHRARSQLRRTLQARLGEAASVAFQFGFARCDRVVATVLARIALEVSGLAGPSA